MEENNCPLCERSGVQLNGEVYCINTLCLAHETDSQEFLRQAQEWLTHNGQSETNALYG